MGDQNWVSCITGGPHASGAGAALTTAATATLSPVGGGTAVPDVALINPAPYGWSVGLLIRYRACGFITTTATSGTLAFSLNSRVGNTGSTYIALTGAHATLNTGTGALTGVQWTLEGTSRCTAIASTGLATVQSRAEMLISPSSATAQTIGTASAGVNLYLPAASGETSVTTLDATQVQGLSLRCTQATSTCTVQLSQWIVETLD